MFKKYTSIVNAYKDTFLTKCYMEVDENVSFVATEKLHGTNFSFIITKDGITHCSRNNVLTMDTKFFNHKMFTKYHDNLNQLFDMINFIESIQVYGEYVGPGVQKGIDYLEPDFYIFDIRIDGYFIPFDEVITYANKINMKIVPILFVGTLEECINYPNEFPSKINPVEGNICEGTVIKPVYEVIYINNERVILKNKNDKWAEKAKMPKRIKNPLTENIRKELDKITPYINENRVNNVISKDVMWQEIDNVKFGKLIQAVIKDICEEVGKTEDDIKPIKKFISREVAKTVRKVCFH